MAQDTIVLANVDSLYREDQFYIGVTYNLPMSLPSGGNIRGLSGGIQFGFLRDMPINKRRNLAIAIGGGLALDQFGQNLFIGETSSEETIFRVLNEQVDYTRNRFNTAVIEAPIEIRWRTSTPASYNFWRVYVGFRVGYAYWYKATFKQPGNTVTQTKIPEFDPVRLAATISLGYNTFNFFASYSINPFFKDAETVNGEIVDFRTLKVGLMFYIL
ncbi:MULTISPECIES: outer membrane beta-barrel protein [Aequorivita]|uniref:Outer membrane beta-barrel protein n=2 Tax=Aequorivita TaxID=153265 RepID=A0AB35YPL8_9FLAO|nr:outer membrane beta-barrel protein [Aequorivita sp. Ant34-E75]WGF93750.1 outer membrane beta-barrel protein [Aequorivita sp. Ant34-E75]